MADSFASSITGMSFSITLRDVSKLVVIVVCCWKVDTTTFWTDSTSPALKSTFSARRLHNTRSIWPVSSARLISRFVFISGNVPTSHGLWIIITFATSLINRGAFLLEQECLLFSSLNM